MSNFLKHPVYCLKELVLYQYHVIEFIKFYTSIQKKSAIVTFQGVSLQSTLPNRIHGHCLWRTVLYTMLYNCVTVVSLHEYTGL